MVLTSENFPVFCHLSYTCSGTFVIFYPQFSTSFILEGFLWQGDCLSHCKEQKFPWCSQSCSPLLVSSALVTTRSNNDRLLTHLLSACSKRNVDSARAGALPALLPAVLSTWSSAWLLQEGFAEGLNTVGSLGSDLCLEPGKVTRSSGLSFFT